MFKVLAFTAGHLLAILILLIGIVEHPWYAFPIIILAMEFYFVAKFISSIGKHMDVINNIVTNIGFTLSIPKQEKEAEKILENFSLPPKEFIKRNFPSL